jgi:hypothetical protein
VMSSIFRHSWLSPAKLTGSWLCVQIIGIEIWKLWYPLIPDAVRERRVVMTLAHREYKCSIALFFSRDILSSVGPHEAILNHRDLSDSILPKT